MGKHTVYTPEDRSSVSHVTHGFKPAGEVGGSCGHQASCRNLWNWELGNSAFLDVWQKAMVNGTEAILLSSPPKAAFLKSSKCLSASLESVLSQYHRL